MAELVDCIVEIGDGHRKTKLKGVWTKADTNKDGFVTHTEFVESVVDADSSIPGRLRREGEGWDQGREEVRIGKD